MKSGGAEWTNLGSGATYKSMKSKLSPVQIKGQFTLQQEIPKPKEYCELRVSCGLSAKNLETAKKALPRSLYSVTLRKAEQLVGMGRVVGDGLHIQVVDIAIHPSHQKQGLSRIILEKIIGYLNEKSDPSATVSLFADVDWLYQKFGFYKSQHSQGMFFRRDESQK